VTQLVKAGAERCRERDAKHGRAEWNDGLSGRRQDEEGEHGEQDREAARARGFGTLVAARRLGRALLSRRHGSRRSLARIAARAKRLPSPMREPGTVARLRRRSEAL